MKTVTRGPVFETSSSSTHSITIVANSRRPRDTLRVDDLGVCRVHPGEFGWEWEEYSDAATKAAYCLTYAKERKSSEYEEMLLAAIQAELPACRTVEFVPQDAEYYHWGYIDHQALDEEAVCQPAFASVETLREFIFNTGSVLRTGNDNERGPW